MANKNVKISEEIAQNFSSLELEGKTTLILSIQGHLALILTLQDQHLAKPEAQQVVDYIQTTLKMKVAMITGDNLPTAHKVARFLGIEPEFVVAEAYPGDKKKSVERWQK